MYIDYKKSLMLNKIMKRRFKTVILFVATVCTLVAINAFFVNHHNPLLDVEEQRINTTQVSPQKLFDHTWQVVKNEYYDPNPSTGGVAVATRPTTVTDLNGPVSEEAASQIEFEVSVALPTLPIGLEERDAVKIEEHLVEIYPTLKRGQAYFYARHCTIGKYYTIAQYKRLLGCAYETARTSMDNLVELGFYRKEKLNNKFIYTPVARR
jgi:hypothetical protein